MNENHLEGSSNGTHFDRSFGSTRQVPRRDRLLSTPITQTKKIDKRSDFFNSLRNDLTLAGDTAIERDERAGSESKTRFDVHSKTNDKNKNRSLLFLSVSETSEEKEFSDTCDSSKRLLII